jgi:hypothetical protein
MHTPWLLVSTVIHEIGHAFYARNRTDGFEEYLEPYFHRDQTDCTPELGSALDFLIYGTNSNTIIDPVQSGYLEHWHLPSARQGCCFVMQKV